MQTERTIVVTGATGFVGAHVCRHFAARGESVVAVLGPSGDDWRLRALHAKDAKDIVRASVDLTSVDQVRALVEEYAPKAIVNCAAYGAYPSQTDPARIYAVDFDAVRILLEAVKGKSGFTAFVQTGSSSEYGTNCSGPREDSLPAPDSHYAVAKLAATSLVHLYATKEAVPAHALRLYSVYGPLEESSRLLPKLLAHARQGTLPPLVNPDISRDFIYVDDVCAAIEAVVTKSAELPAGGVYNIGSGTKTTLRDLVDVTRATFAISAEPEWGSMANRRWDHAEWFANPKKAADVFGWKANVSLAEGLRRTMEWEKVHAAEVEAAAARSVLQVSEQASAQVTGQVSQVKAS